MFSLPTDTISGILSYANAFFNDVKIYIFLALGLSLAMFIIYEIGKAFFGLEDDEEM